jgi:hypothetical protein
MTPDLAKKILAADYDAELYATIKELYKAYTPEQIGQAIGRYRAELALKEFEASIARQEQNLEQLRKQI